MRRSTGRIAVALAAALGACGGPSEPPLSQEALADVLTDLHLAEARADAFASGASRDSLRRVYRADALAAHGLDSAAWAGALEALAGTPDRLTTAYDTVLSRLSQEPSGLPRAPSRLDRPVDAPAAPIKSPLIPRP